MIDKTTAAKYEVTWGMQPHLVSSGAQRTSQPSRTWSRRWEVRARRLQRALLEAPRCEGSAVRAVRTAIAKADWYQKGYLANYVTYTLAKLAYEVGRQAKGRAFDLESNLGDPVGSPEP